MGIIWTLYRVGYFQLSPLGLQIAAIAMDGVNAIYAGALNGLA